MSLMIWIGGIFTKSETCSACASVSAYAAWASSDALSLDTWTSSSAWWVSSDVWEM